MIDLGIKVASNRFIQAIKREKPDMVGLSGLLVKSAQQMVFTAQDMKEAGIAVPILLAVRLFHGNSQIRKFPKNMMVLFFMQRMR